MHEPATFSEPKESVMKLIEDGSSDWDSQLHGESGPNGIQGRVAQMAFLKQPRPGKCGVYKMGPQTSYVWNYRIPTSGLIQSYTWVTGVVTPKSGVITLVINGRGPHCMGVCMCV